MENRRRSGGMLQSINLKGFKSFEDATLQLAPTLTCLIGPNASGKTNAIEALKFMNWLTDDGNLQEIYRESFFRGKEINYFFNKLSKAYKDSFTISATCSSLKNEDFCFEQEIKLDCDTQRLFLRKEKLANLSSQDLIFENFNSNHSQLTEINVDAMASMIILKQNDILEEARLRALEDGQITSEEIDRVIKSIKKTSVEKHKNIFESSSAVHHYLSNIYVIDPIPQEMRDYNVIGDNLLQENGENLSSVIYELTNQPVLMEKLVSFVTTLPEQNIIHIECKESEDTKLVMVKIIEKFGLKNVTYPASLLSDGTLRVLAIGVSLLTLPCESLIIMEEIDNGVHPSRLKTLINNIYDIAKERNLQVLFTTHNPALLDALPPETIQDVNCCYRNPETGASEIKRLGDMDNFIPLIAKGPLGYLATSNLIQQYILKKSPLDDRFEAVADLLDQLKND